MKLTPILKLVRLSALPSAWADQFGGMALASVLVGAGYWRFEPWKIALLLPMSFGIYLGGMALNDVLHVRKDRLLHKPRPLATGDLTLAQGWAITLLLFTLGIVCGFAAGWFIDTSRKPGGTGESLATLMRYPFWSSIVFMPSSAIEVC